jgi:hypothetical protein
VSFDESIENAAKSKLVEVWKAMDNLQVKLVVNKGALALNLTAMEKESKNVEEKDPSIVATDPSETSEEKKRRRQAVTDATESKSKKSRKSSNETNKKLPFRQKISFPTCETDVSEVSLVNIEDVSSYGKEFSNAYIPG